MKRTPNDTIFAIATPPGVGGIGVTRVSGPEALAICAELTGVNPKPRYATLCSFLDGDGTSLDTGVVVFFAGPNSFTGEDVIELQGHGGAVVQQMLSRRLLELGARPAQAGEFSERAFLNDKLDLAQAEAIADLVSSGTESAARAAQRSLQGVFSNRVAELQDQMTGLRVFIEAALDFPDEEIDFIAESDTVEKLQQLLASNQRLLDDAHQGQILRDGVTVAIIGQPNAGKSSLLNALAGRDAAIVTDVPGTTRDVLRETISLDGLPVHIADTAGIRESSDVVEAEGIRRARGELAQADMVLLVLDETQDLQDQTNALHRELPEGIPTITIINKIDISGRSVFSDEDSRTVGLSAKNSEGIGLLVSMMTGVAGLNSASEGVFSARTRHLDALRRTRQHLETGKQQLEELGLPETLAEELRLAQQQLGEITGEFLPDDLLGAIFSSFCIGK